METPSSTPPVIFLLQAVGAFAVGGILSYCYGTLARDVLKAAARLLRSVVLY